MRPPSEAEAAAIAAALEWLLAEERRAAGGAADPRPPQYRSPWRRAALTPRPFEPAPAGSGR